MKVKELKNKLESKLNGKKRVSHLKKEFRGKEDNTKDLKIIGITGSRGKSSTAYIVHEYLKQLGYKSVLYSSVKVDSPASFTNPNEAVEVAILNEEVLLDIIEEANSYNADYLVLEVNETAIEKGLVKDIDFDVRVLTNYYSNYNNEFYNEDEYFELKKSFFRNINKDSICVMGLTGTIQSDEFEELLKLNNNPKVTFGSNYLAVRRGYNVDKLDCLYHKMDTTFDRLNFTIKVDGVDYEFTSKAFLPHNGLNFACAISTLKALNVFDVKSFRKCIKDLTIPGRDEVIKVGGRVIVIGMFFNPAFDTFRNFKVRNMINGIKVVTGAVGLGFKTWEDRYSSNKFINSRRSIRKGMMDSLKYLTDYVYLTSNDPASEGAESICSELQGYLDEKVPSEIIIDREEAIRKALSDSKEGDLIFISGRGNRKVMCTSYDKVKLVKDKDVCMKVIKELNWK